MENMLPCKNPEYVKRLCTFINEVTREEGNNPDVVYRQGDCGRFAMYLKKAFNCAKFRGVNAEYYYDRVICTDKIPASADDCEHVVTQIGDKCYDVGGEFELEYEPNDYPELHPEYVKDSMSNNYFRMPSMKKARINYAVEQYIQTPEMFRG